MFVCFTVIYLPVNEKIFGACSCSAILATHIEDMVATCKEHLVRLVGMEEHDTFTMNTHYFVDAKAAFLARLKKANLPLAGAVKKVCASMIYVCHYIWIVVLFVCPDINICTISYNEINVPANHFPVGPGDCRHRNSAFGRD